MSSNLFELIWYEEEQVLNVHAALNFHSKLIKTKYRSPNKTKNNDKNTQMF